MARPYVPICISRPVVARMKTFAARRRPDLSDAASGYGDDGAGRLPFGMCGRGFVEQTRRTWLRNRGPLNIQRTNKCQCGSGHVQQEARMKRHRLLCLRRVAGG